jgi:hypothetical protein
VFSNRKWQQFALILNLAGTALLFYSFQATSSDFRLVTAVTKSVLADNKQYALCVNDYALLETDSAGRMQIGHKSCPDWEHAKPAAVVNIEHPIFEGLGFVTLLAGFLIQYLAVPQPRTVAQIREELKQLKAEQKKSQSISN